MCTEILYKLVLLWFYYGFGMLWWLCTRADPKARSVVVTMILKEIGVFEYTIVESLRVVQEHDCVV